MNRTISNWNSCTIWDPYYGTNPEVYVTINRNRVKIYDDKVYLKPHTDFEFEFNNPCNGRVLAKIWINEKLISSSGIILDSNSSNYLERYIDSNRKFNFKTFHVDDVEDTERQRERNGKVKIKFYKEEQPNITWTYDSYQSQPRGFNPDHPTIRYSNSGGTGNLFTDNDVTYSSGYAKVTPTSMNVSKQVETGRIEEGGKSKQNLTTTTGNFESTSFHTVEYHLVPESTKPPQDISQIRTYCPECGMRVRKSSWKYCPQCGENL